MTVTLGRYETEAEAKNDLARFTRERNYRDLLIEPIEPPPPKVDPPR